MSNYRSFYGLGSMTARQYRRYYRKTDRDQRLSLIECYERNPSRPRGLSGHPGRRRIQMAERAR